MSSASQKAWQRLQFHLTEIDFSFSCVQARYVSKTNSVFHMKSNLVLSYRQIMRPNLCFFLQCSITAIDGGGFYSLLLPADSSVGKWIKCFSQWPSVNWLAYLSWMLVLTQFWFYQVHLISGDEVLCNMLTLLCYLANIMKCCFQSLQTITIFILIKK